MFIISYRLPYEKLDSTIEELAINDIYNVFYENPLEITTDDYGYGYIERDDEEIILTSAEYKLLLILIHVLLERRFQHRIFELGSIRTVQMRDVRSKSQDHKS